MTSAVGSEPHRWALVSEEDPLEHEVCITCGAQRNRNGPVDERAFITGGWPSPMDCELLRIFSDDEAAAASLSAEERTEYERCKQSVIDARRSAERNEGQRYIG